MKKRKHSRKSHHNYGQRYYYSKDNSISKPDSLVAEPPQRKPRSMFKNYRATTEQIDEIAIRIFGPWASHDNLPEN